MNLPQNVPATEKTCPHLGLSHDPSSLMDYPCAENVCYHANPHSSPAEGHQKKFCLEPAHKTCLLFAEASSKPMPNDISNIRRKRWFHINIFPWIMGISFLIITGLFYYNWPQIEPNLIVPTLVPTGEQPVIAAIIPNTGSRQEEETPRIELSATVSDSPIPTFTLTMVDTIEPTETVTQHSTSTEHPTNTPQPPHALQTPFGLERQYLIHRVLGGETLEWIAKNHGTSVEAIRAANFDMSTSLWEDSMLVIPFNQTNIEEIIPMSTYKVTGEETSIETMAEEKEINLLLLCQVNDRPHSYVFVPGEWVLIPHPVTPTAP
jgi:hypothetical protein